MRLVYLSPVPWESFAQRPHKFVEWFFNRTGEPVLWIDPYPTRFPSWKDLWRLRLSPLAGKRNSIPDWLTLLEPRGLPIEPMPGSGWINELLWRSQLREISNFAECGTTMLAIGKPSALALLLLESLHCHTSLYDAMDDFPAFYSGCSRLALARKEHAIVQRADIILASSSELKTRWTNIHNNVRLIHNGLDLPAVRSVEPTTKPSEFKVFGYAGTIASWFDWEWVLTLAEARPEDEIRLIGPMFISPANKLPANINLQPACDHAVALKAMMQFHVGLIPFKKNGITVSVDPIKFYEYRALGLPVISTDFGEMSLRAGEHGIFITRSLNDVSVIADAAIQFCGYSGDASAFTLQNNWEARFDAAMLLP